MTPHKIYIAGLCAAGKSTFARKLAAIARLPVYHMDTFIWQENWVQTPDADVEVAVRDVLRSDRWIIEGWIQVEDALRQADIVIHLDPPAWRLAWQEFMRFIQGQFAIRPELAIGCKDDFDIKRLWRLLTQNDPELDAQLDRVPPGKLLRLASRRAQEEYLRDFL